LLSLFAAKSDNDVPLEKFFSRTVDFDG